MPGNRLLLACSREDVLEIPVPGWEIVRLPVCQVRSLDSAWSGDADAAVVTSRHAVAWLVRSGFRGRVAAAGEGTARALEAAGIPCLRPEGLGGEAALARLAPRAGERVLFAGGERTAGSVEAEAARRGIELERVVAYRLEPVPALRLPAGEIGALAFLSGQMVDFFLQGLGGEVPSRFRDLPVLATATAEAVLRTQGWAVGRIVGIEKSSLGSGLSRLLLEARRPEAREGGPAARTGGCESGDDVETARPS